MRKPAIAAAAALLLALHVTTPAGAAGVASTYGPASNPVLFVHGYSGSASNWNTMVGRFKNDGWPASHLDQWGYDSRQSNVTTAQQLATEVDRLLAATGASKVDVIAHSMGGLSSRHYAKNLGGDAKIEAWVSLGGPNHGTDTANGCFDASCAEMRAGSSFLTALNSGDETPGSPRYATWWSPCDTVINPDSSVALSGATNTRTACVSHNGLLSDATVYAQARDLINS
ncbi:lipase [Streptomyces agglomeratus]|uniref:Lipase n=1 Tax=Streptomyces agglomeratus TaxID=285458 RepID=A0A1E5PC20_9ACTN|nr:triacylglycerol lipase [Streptomyces agglomeratus]OEJ27079.1 lipase [Streptomyces agglomeratus]OEJ38870.1 lipase [Streptomyces agglomeratus]OEJ46746.1 lipase [Streptomyces agglomeratus]OEJ51400.1 lipase [Streptomyces agglomeratus]OEJ58801.1 lipase [Streptomyces agglomeratus]